MVGIAEVCVETGLAMTTVLSAVPYRCYYSCNNTAVMAEKKVEPV